MIVSSFQQTLPRLLQQEGLREYFRLLAEGVKTYDDAPRHEERETSQGRERVLT